MPPPSAVVDSLSPVGFVSTSTNTKTVHLHPVVLPSSSPQEEEQSVAVGVNDQTLPKTVEEEHDHYPHIPPKGWFPPVMNIAPGSIIPSKLKEGYWVLHQGMQIEKIIKRVIHRHVQADTKKKVVRHIHIQTDMPSTRGLRHVCNKQCHVEHTECFNATHSCKKQMVKNFVQTGFQVANKVQENLSASNIQDKVISFIPECVNKISTTLNKKKAAAVMGMQNPEPCTSTGVQTSRKSTSLIPKRKTTTTSKASTLPISQASKKGCNSPPTPPPRRSSSSTTTVQIHMPPMTTRSVAKIMQIHQFNYVKQKTKSAKKAIGEMSAKAKSVTTRLTTPRTTCKRGKKQ